MRRTAVVMGGGSTGAATAHDLALRGLKVILVERGAIASGTTGRSHCLLHSGGRYAVTDQAQVIPQPLNGRTSDGNGALQSEGALPPLHAIRPRGQETTLGGPRLPAGVQQHTDARAAGLLRRTPPKARMAPQTTLLLPTVTPHNTP
ncbi:glycerol-3-phosphate dehydrogenase, partial [Candidatus Hakubella thermalkaliphila]